MNKYIDADKLKEVLKKSIYPSSRCGKTFNSLLEFVMGLVDTMPAAEVIPIEVVENYLSDITDEWNKLGDRKYELANMQVYNHIRKERDDLAEWREKNV